MFFPPWVTHRLIQMLDAMSTDNNESSIINHIYDFFLWDFMWPPTAEQIHEGLSDPTWTLWREAWGCRNNTPEKGSSCSQHLHPEKKNKKFSALPLISTNVLQKFFSAHFKIHFWITLWTLLFVTSKYRKREKVTENVCHRTF